LPFFKDLTIWIWICSSLWYGFFKGFGVWSGESEEWGNRPAIIQRHECRWVMGSGKEEAALAGEELLLLLLSEF
jgi:hypothetical protein